MLVKLVSSSFIINPRTDDEQELYIDGWVHYSEDRSYGKDADGHRGVYRMFVENVTEVIASTDEGETYELSDVEKECAEQVLVETFLNE